MSLGGCLAFILNISLFESCWLYFLQFKIHKIYLFWGLVFGSTFILVH